MAEVSASRKKELELLVMAHRYLYYVMSKPVLSDIGYDELEREAWAALPPDNVVHRIGSSNDSDYTEEQKRKAKDLRDDADDFLAMNPQG